MNCISSPSIGELHGYKPGMKNCYCGKMNVKTKELKGSGGMVTQHTVNVPTVGSSPTFPAKLTAKLGDAALIKMQFKNIQYGQMQQKVDLPEDSNVS